MVAARLRVVAAALTRRRRRSWEESLARSLAPDDLYRLRIPTDPRLSPDGTSALVTLQSSAPRGDGYRQAVWLVPLEGAGGPRRLTIGSKHDRQGRFSPDGRTVAFISDRRFQVEEEPDEPKDANEREDGDQVHILPLDGGEARRLTDLPRGVDEFAWSPDGRWLLITTSSHGATRKDDRRARGIAKREPADPPESDYRYIDRLGYMYNGTGFVYDSVAHIWIVDAGTGHARRLTDGPAPDEGPAWSPDGRQIAFSTQVGRDHDIRFRSNIVVVDVETGRRTPITSGDDSVFVAPAWLPDGRTLAVLGGRLPANGYRNDIWLFAADGSDAAPGGGRNISDRHDIMPGSAMNSDITPGEGARLVPSDDGAWLTFLAPIDGGHQRWRIATDDGKLERLTDGRQYISSFDQVTQPGGRLRTASLRSSATELSDLWVQDGLRGKPRRVTAFNEEALAGIELREPEERHVTVEGRDIQGWIIRAGGASTGPRPLISEIHGGPHTLYGWSPVMEFQVLAGAGIDVFYSNPRGSQGYGRAFNEANLRDWGPGPMRDVIGGIEALVADGLADPDRLGLTGGSYGGYLTNWIVAHDQRFRAAITCRTVSDMTMLFLTGDISGGDWAKQEFGVTPWEDPGYYREISPLTYADAIRTPLLIQHGERDLRTTVGQAEALFTVLRSKKRPVRLMRVPDESHELTRSGTPYRRVENLVQVRDWFRHYLVDGRKGLPPLPKARAGK